MTAAGLLRRAGRRPAALLAGEGAAVSVEAVIVMPVLVWAFVATLVFWDGFRASTLTVRAAHVVSDLASRERAALDQGFLDDMRSVFEEVARAGRAGRGEAGSIRMSVARSRIDAEAADADGDITYETTLVLDWSHTSGDGLAPATSIDEVRAHVPTLAPGDQLMVVETAFPWTPPAGSVLPGRTLSGVAIGRHRFGQRLCWEAC